MKCVALKNKESVNAFVYSAHSDLSKEIKAPQRFNCTVLSGETLSNCRLMQNIQHGNSYKWSV